MPYSIQLLVLIASLSSLKSDKKSQGCGSNEADLRKAIEPILNKVCQLVAEFQQQPLTPTQACRFEHQLREIVRELGRLVSQWTYNHAEPATEMLPKHVWFEGLDYTRLNEKTSQNVWTLFGQVKLQRVGYRPTNKTGDATIFPLALSLGLVQGATPALAERASWYLGNSGVTQSQTLERLRQDHGVCWGVKKLRQVSGAVSAAMAEQQHESQVERLLELLQQASASTGKHKPVLSVGRDGITLGTRCKGGSVFEVATTGTVTVFDRRDRRLGTLYLAYTPEFGQKTMSNALTQGLRIKSYLDCSYEGCFCQGNEPMILTDITSPSWRSSRGYPVYHSTPLSQAQRPSHQPPQTSSLAGHPRHRSLCGSVWRQRLAANRDVRQTTRSLASTLSQTSQRHPLTRHL